MKLEWSIQKAHACCTSTLWPLAHTPTLTYHVHILLTHINTMKWLGDCTCTLWPLAHTPRDTHTHTPCCGLEIQLHKHIVTSCSHLPIMSTCQQTSQVAYAVFMLFVLCWCQQPGPQIRILRARFFEADADNGVWVFVLFQICWFVLSSWLNLGNFISFMSFRRWWHLWM